jgi:glycosyltransferase involved in cell wall biosynthesis
VRGRGGQEAATNADRRVVILLASAWGLGGTIRAAHNLAGYLVGNYDVEIVSVFRRRDEPFFPFPPGLEVTALDDLRKGATPRRLRLLRSILRRCPSVLMHPADRAAHVANLWVDFGLVRRLRGKSGFLIATRPGLNLMAADLAPPGLITIGEEQMHLRAHSWPLRGAMRRLYPRLDYLVTLTEQDMHEYEKLFAESPNRPRLAHIPNTVGDIGGPQADLGARTILAAGRLTAQKGFDLLIPAFKRTASAHPDWRLRICGKGHLRNELQKQIDEEGLAEVVRLAGPQDMAKEMATASIFVLSSRFEGFPLILIEAMSKGMAVVSFDCPTGPREVIRDHENGLLVPPLDVDALANAILELVEDEDLRRRCGPAAAETAGRYRIEAVGPQWEALFEGLARERGLRPAQVAARSGSEGPAERSEPAQRGSSARAEADGSEVTSLSER